MSVQETYAKAFNRLQDARRYYRSGVYSRRELQAIEAQYDAAVKAMDEVA